MSQVETIDRVNAGSESSAPVRVAVVDDHESVRLGLKAAFIDEGNDFVLAASTVDGLWSEQPAAVSIIVHPQFFQTWWFYVLIGALLLWIATRLYQREKLLG